eukprot:565585_1
MGMCGLHGSPPRDITSQPTPKYGTTTSNPPLMHAQTLTHHIDSNISDSEKQRSFLQTAWKKYYRPFVSKYSKNRVKFVCFQTLCNDLKINTVQNTEHRVYDQTSECYQIHVFFHITFSIAYHKHVVHLAASIEFDDAFWLFQSNPFDASNTDWEQKLVVLEQKTSSNELLCVIQKDVATVDRHVCGVLQNTLNIDANDGSEILYEFFSLFWQWFISKEVIQFKDKNISSYETYRDIQKDSNSDDATDTNNDIVTNLRQPSKLSARDIIDRDEATNVDEMCGRQRQDSNLSVGNVIDTKGEASRNNIDVGMDDDTKENVDMNENTRQFYIFLEQNGWQQYFDGFKAHDCCEIGYIPDLMSNDKYLQNVIGIDHEIHRARFIRECGELMRQKEEFQKLIPSLVFEKLSKHYGIISLNMLCNDCSQVGQIEDLKRKYNIMDDRQCLLLWNIMKRQLHPQQEQSQNEYSLEGTQHEKPVVLAAEEQPFTSQF